MESLVEQGKYTKIDESGKTIAECADKAWSKVWELSLNGELKRAFTIDYESTVPAERRQNTLLFVHCGKVRT